MTRPLCLLNSDVAGVRTKQGVRLLALLDFFVVVQVRLHVDQSEGLLQEYYQHSARDPVLIKAVFVHVSLLSKHE